VVTSGLVALLVYVVDPHDVLAADRSDGASLTLQPLPEGRVVGVLRTNQLDRDFAVEPLIARTPDHAHPAGRDALFEAVAVSEQLAGC
jgi:hypothetical protein